MRSPNPDRHFYRISSAPASSSIAKPLSRRAKPSCPRDRCRRVLNDVSLRLCAAASDYGEEDENPRLPPESARTVRKVAAST
jgi:hypothetical protein